MNLAVFSRLALKNAVEIPMPKLTDEQKRQKAKKLDNWTMFDLTLWSDHPDFGKIVDTVLTNYIKKPGFKGRPTVWERNLTILLANRFYFNLKTLSFRPGQRPRALPKKDSGPAGTEFSPTKTIFQANDAT